MPRQARSISETGIYHIMLRGNERKKIFLDDDDRLQFINTMFDKLIEEKSEIYAYCLMNNHVHLLIGESDNNLSRIMKRINVSYVYYFNKKYKRVGHLFQDRFKSENVDNEPYMLEAVRYIHNNPVKAGIVSNPENYIWSSYNDYIKINISSKLCIMKVLEFFDDNSLLAVKHFVDFSNKSCNDEFIEYKEKSLSEIRQEQAKLATYSFQEFLLLEGISCDDLLHKDNCVLRNEIIRCLKQKYDLSIRQMEEVTGIGRGAIVKLFAKMREDDR